MMTAIDEQQIKVILVVLLLAFIIAVTRACIRNARAIKRDVDQRFEKIRADLEKQGNATLDHILDREK